MCFFVFLKSSIHCSKDKQFGKRISLLYIDPLTGVEEWLTYISE
jgi:hypothetical protein